MNRQKLFILVVLLGCLTACTKPNPDACCTNEAECLALGSTELRPCDAGRVCSNNQCFEAQCETAAQCSSGTPYCVNQLCVGSCKVEADCSGVPGAPLCADDQVCVGCRGNADCSGATPICDAEDRACRGCETDGDCASGVCLEADGVCAREEEVVFVVPGRSDAGECGRSSPCGTLSYAVAKSTPARSVIRIDGGQLLGVDSTLLLNGRTLYIDSSGTPIVFGGTPGDPMMRVSASGRITIEGVRFTPGMRDHIAVEGSGSLRLNRVVVSREQAFVMFPGFVRQVGGNIAIRNSEIYQVTSCVSGGGLTIETSRIGVPTAAAPLSSVDCILTLRRNTFNAESNTLYVSGGTVSIENNLFLSSNELADLMSIQSVGVGSRFSFNTIVNTTGVTSEGGALACDASLRVENNVIAFRSTRPHIGACSARFTLYDDAYVSPPGEGNVAVPFSGIFVNPSSGDFRPSATSRARAMSGLGASIVEDHDGSHRPLPAGTNPDVGAFEVP